jgi:hypothetical protein
MKPVIMSVLLTIVLGLTTAQAKENFAVHNQLKKSIQREFGRIESITYYDQGNYTMGLFMDDGHQTAAFFEKESGEMLGSARSVSSEELPFQVLKTVEKKFSAAEFLQILEITNKEGTFYSMSLENTNKYYRINVEPTGDLLNVSSIQIEKQ